MPKRNLKRKVPQEHKRYCRCTPFCGKKLTQQARRLHYKKLRPSQRDEMQDSETATEFDNNLSSESGRGSPSTSIYGSDDNDDIEDSDASLDQLEGDHQHHQMEYDETELKDGSDNMVSEDDQEGFLGSDSESEFEDWKDFDEENETALSDEEKLEELEDILSSENYAELWQSRLCFFIYLLRV
jgi:hypothetical protein